ncbi:10856_t:CDS:2 [Dentiscutata erythropus]|uniref:10856_t:CDS:1 n=1 Tax=Dentiscutata erythropus TaxID=1348616 RepID=A0A9N9J4E9_9GLOM|nr:10856_t:CDS:2 [Dentiscutata erythropus]
MMDIVLSNEEIMSHLNEKTMKPCEKITKETFMISSNEEEMTRVNDETMDPCEKMTEETTPVKENKKRSNEEDNKLRTLVAISGAKKWGNIAELMGTRNAKQCRERWDSHLKPGINKASKKPFTPLEEKTILKWHLRGAKWAKIALKLGNGRTPNDIKNAYNQRIRKKYDIQIMMSIERLLN